MSQPPVTPPGSADAAARLVAQLTEVAVIELDPDGVIVSWNEGARRLKGYEAVDAVGRSFEMFYGPDDRATGLPQALLLQARTTGSAQHSGFRVRRDGSRFWADVLITALHHDDGTLAGYAKVTRDLTDRHELEVELRRSEERFRSLVEQVVDYAIIGLDRAGEVVSWNAGAERLKEYPTAEALGQHFSIFYTADDRADGLPQRLLQRALDDGHVEHTGWRVRRGGTQFWGNVVITALRDDDGRVTGFAKVIRDLTAQKRFEEARESFFHAFAHDFRAPVAAIAGFAEVFHDADPELAADLVDRIGTNARRLVDMTNDLVEHSRLAARSTAAPTRLRLHDVVDGVARGLGDGAAGRIDVAVGDVVLHADRSALERVLVNLLSNALKYSAAETTVGVAAAVLRDRVMLVVADRGRGIDALDLPHIFDEFQRGRLSEDDGGHGIGLASVRRLVEAMEGTVSISSRVGVGTTVTVDLPVAGPAR
ncbi:PAS domain-containing sensor histidine kinase [Nocardioides sp. C4-1]|uniref:sensor histidine kinase n=1 Tax=Nocardioides sp. C4-1 TaxID=3151851 RepID=UPI003266FA9A